MKGLKVALLAAGLATWYTINGCIPNSKKTIQEKYPLPAEIKVIDSSIHYEERERTLTIIDSDGNKTKENRLEKVVKTEDIDFSGDFEIKTERYRLVKDNDWLPSRLVGHIFSIPLKLYFWDWDVSWGVDEDRARAVLSMLESNENIKDLTVRLNHNEALYDLYRIFTDKHLRERNNFLARSTLGTLTCLADEIWAEFGRGDYYNPLSKTVVVYSNIESIAAHELGHHTDYERFTSDWEYGLLGMLPPVKLYKEWIASTNAKTSIMSPDDNWQFYRYLLPAFFTYVLGSIATVKKLFKSKDNKK